MELPVPRSLLLLLAVIFCLRSGDSMEGETQPFQNYSFWEDDLWYSGNRSKRAIGAEISCSFPFLFHGTFYGRCTTDGGARFSWCSLTSKYDDDLTWGACSSSGTAMFSCFSISLYNGSVPATCNINPNNTAAEAFSTQFCVLNGSDRDGSLVASCPGPYITTQSTTATTSMATGSSTQQPTSVALLTTLGSTTSTPLNTTRTTNRISALNTTTPLTTNPPTSLNITLTTTNTTRTPNLTTSSSSSSLNTTLTTTNTTTPNLSTSSSSSLNTTLTTTNTTTTPNLTTSSSSSSSNTTLTTTNTTTTPNLTTSSSSSSSNTTLTTTNTTTTPNLTTSSSSLNTTLTTTNTTTTPNLTTSSSSLNTTLTTTNTTTTPNLTTSSSSSLNTTLTTTNTTRTPNLTTSSSSLNTTLTTTNTTTTPNLTTSSSSSLNTTLTTTNTTRTPNLTTSSSSLNTTLTTTNTTTTPNLTTSSSSSLNTTLTTTNTTRTPNLTTSSSSSLNTTLTTTNTTRTPNLTTSSSSLNTTLTTTNTTRTPNLTTSSSSSLNTTLTTTNTTTTPNLTTSSTSSSSLNTTLTTTNTTTTPNLTTSSSSSLNTTLTTTNTTTTPNLTTSSSSLNTTIPTNPLLALNTTSLSTRNLTTVLDASTPPPENPATSLDASTLPPENPATFLEASTPPPETQYTLLDTTTPSAPNTTTPSKLGQSTTPSLTTSAATSGTAPATATISPIETWLQIASSRTAGSGALAVIDRITEYISSSTFMGFHLNEVRLILYTLGNVTEHVVQSNKKFSVDRITKVVHIANQLVGDLHSAPVAGAASDLASLLLKNLEIIFAEMTTTDGPFHVSFANMDLRCSVFSCRDLKNESVMVLHSGVNVSVPREDIDQLDPLGCFVNVLSMTYSPQTGRFNSLYDGERNTDGGFYVASDIRTNILLLNNRNTHNAQINMTFQCKGRDCDQTAVCAFYDFLSSVWSSEGCITQVTDGLTKCFCSHLTSFSVLMSNSVPSDPFHSQVLNYITTAGLAISMASLITCISIQAILLSQANNPMASYRHVSILNMSAFLLISHISFVASSYTKPRADNPVCVALTYCTHLSLLGFFFWTAVQGVFLVCRLVFVFHHVTKREFVTLSVVLGYICPISIATATFLVYNPNNNYMRADACWLNNNSGASLAFIIPTIISISGNVLVLVVVIRKLLRPSISEGSGEDEDAVKKLVKAVVFCTPQFGLTWAIGIPLLNNKYMLALDYMFALLNPLQGFFILLFACLLDKKVMDLVKNRMSRTPPLTSTATSVSTY